MNTRTNIVLDDELIAKAMARARVTTKKAAVEAALRAYVREPDYSGLLALEGSDVIADGYDPKALFTGSGVGPHFVSDEIVPYRVTSALAKKSVAVRKPAVTKGATKK